MRDRDSKREADRERRARIKAGTWDFPNGGAAEFAKAGAAIRTSSKRQGRSPKSLDLPAKPEVFTSAPAPRPIPSAPVRTIAPTPAGAPSTSSGLPSMSRLADGPVLASSTKAPAILRRLTLPLSRRSRNGARTLKPCWRH